MLVLCRGVTGGESCQAIPDSAWLRAIALAALCVYVCVVWQVEAYVASQDEESGSAAREGAGKALAEASKCNECEDEGAPLLGACSVSALCERCGPAEDAEEEGMC